MKMINYKIFLLIAFAFLSSCNSGEKKEKISLNEEVIKNCLNEIINPDPNSIDSTYIVNPYLDSFSFNKFTARNFQVDEYTFKNKKKVLEKIGMNEAEFSVKQKEIDSLFFKKSFLNLEKFSKGKKTHRVINFSGISDNLVFVEIFTFCDVINKKDLESGKIVFSKENIKDVSSLAIILNDNKIKEVTVDNGIVFEKQCFSTK
jgi:hypothetical protein